MASSICGGSILQGLPVVEIAVAGRGHDHFMAGPFAALHPSADALRDSFQSVFAPAEPSAARRSPVLQSARKASCPIHHQVHGLIVEGERQLKGGGKQLSRM